MSALTLTKSPRSSVLTLTKTPEAPMPKPLTLQHVPGRYTVTDTGDAVRVAVRVEKLPNRHGYGYTLENGNATRAEALRIARGIFSPVPPAESVTLDPVFRNDFHVGSQVWREYIVQGIKSPTN